jgi:hypothetical protein
MKCAIEGCAEIPCGVPVHHGAPDRPLCYEHATAWHASGEGKRACDQWDAAVAAGTAAFDRPTRLDCLRRWNVALVDFIQRISAEERNAR